ncbi:DUF5677 domain-containing protein [Cytobacillus firmus]|uniref:DUF5677 domain-containing protein n=1 Tax=Cytobacillus firmus TaxID=1399 RepID=UPI0024C1D026|nr:DUF5677 domain-containing protein [Cytobacillus firmus]WHY63247.1 DUF5677 domain-containing protein [Cytobacillus firmus]
MKTFNRVIIESEKVFEKVIDGYFKPKGIKVDISDVVILGLLENLINHSKSMKILLENNHYASLDTILRVIFENFVFIKYILDKDTEYRSKSYFYSTKIKEIKLLNMITEDSLEGSEVRKFLELKKDEVKEKLKAETMDENYKTNIYETYSRDFGMSHPNQKWYNLDGKTKSLKLLCEKLGLTIDFNLIYSILSIETHGKDAIRNFSIEEDRVDLINMVKNKELYLSMSAMYIMESVGLIYSHYDLKRLLKTFNTMVAINHFR